jgi:CDP-glycerol glycerophosphotransferase
VESPKLQVTRPLSGQDQLLPLALSGDGRDFSVRIPFRPIIEDTNPDDPFTQRTTWAFRLLGTNDEEKLLLWTAPPRSAAHAEQGRLVTLTRSTGGYVNLHETPFRVTADHAEEVAGSNELRVAGALADGESAYRFSWRRYIDDNDDHVDVECRQSVEDGVWTATVGLTELVPAEVTTNSADPLASLADWILFAVAPDGAAHAVQCDPFLSSKLPVELETEGHTAALRPHAGTLHVEVR